MQYSLALNGLFLCVLFNCVLFNCEINVWHLHPQHKPAPDSPKLSQIGQITVTWQQPKPAVAAAEQLQQHGKTPLLLCSIIPPSHQRTGIDRSTGGFLAASWVHLEISGNKDWAGTMWKQNLHICMCTHSDDVTCKVMEVHACIGYHTRLTVPHAPLTPSERMRSRVGNHIFTLCKESVNGGSKT